VNTLGKALVPAIAAGRISILVPNCFSNRHQRLTVLREQAQVGCITTWIAAVDGLAGLM